MYIRTFTFHIAKFCCMCVLRGYRPLLSGVHNADPMVGPRAREPVHSSKALCGLARSLHRVWTHDMISISIEYEKGASAALM